MRIKIYEIYPSKKSLLMAWGDQLMSDRHKEAIITLENENVILENLYFFEIDKKSCILFTTIEGKNGFNKERSLMPIDHEHKAILRECIKKEIPHYEIYNLYLDQISK